MIDTILGVPDVYLLCMEATLTGKLEHVHRQTGSRLLRYIRRQIPDFQEADDILHDIFARAAETLSIAEPHATC